MKKLLFCAFTCLILISVSAQQKQAFIGIDTTISKVKDTLKNYTFTNVYMVIASIDISKSVSPSFLKEMADPVWRAIVSVNYYATRADFKSGKDPINTQTYRIDFTTIYPTQKELFDKIALLLPK